MKTLVKNCDIVATMNEKNEEIRNADVLVEDNRIIKIENKIPEKTEAVLDGRGKILLPGFVNTHHHFYQILNRNIPSVQNAPLFQWLLTLYEIWKYLDPEWVRASTRLACAELLLSGCTTALDHYYIFPKNQPQDMIDTEIEEAGKMGIRLHITRGGMSRGKSEGGLPPDVLVQKEDVIMKDYERLVKKYHDPEDFSKLRVIPAPCSPFSVTEKLLKETVEFARKNKLQCHTHLAETLDEENYCIENMGKRPAEWMEEIGFLGEDIIMAHCIHLNDEDILRLGRYRTGVAHCPSSNLRLASGIAPIKKLHDAGAGISIGVDGSASNDSSNLWLEGRMAMLVSRIRGGEGKEGLTAREALRFLTKGGAAVLGRTDIGEIAPGKAADLILINRNTIPFAGGETDPVAALIFCGGNFTCDTVMVDGKIVVRNGNLVESDQEEIIREARRIGDKISSRI
ncbi:MAG TPA: 8-oxoguanine deaminase [bacterium]|nr:8-oxoguanine deaminase [bacterium]